MDITTIIIVITLLIATVFIFGVLFAKIISSKRKNKSYQEIDNDSIGKLIQSLSQWSYDAEYLTKLAQQINSQTNIKAIREITSQILMHIFNHPKYNEKNDILKIVGLIVDIEAKNKTLGGQKI